MHAAERIDTPPPDQKSPVLPPARGANANGGDSGGGHGDGYEALVSSLAAVTDGFTGAELAGLVRAAASYALERAVSGGGVWGNGARECRVTVEDFGRGLADVSRSKSSGGRATKETEALVTAPAAVEGGGEKMTDGALVEAEGGEVNRLGAVAQSTAAAAAAVAAARLEDDVGGSLSPEVRRKKIVDVERVAFLLALSLFCVCACVEVVFLYQVGRNVVKIGDCGSQAYGGRTVSLQWYTLNVFVLRAPLEL